MKIATEDMEAGEPLGKPSFKKKEFENVANRSFLVLFFGKWALLVPKRKNDVNAVVVT